MEKLLLFIPQWQDSGLTSELYHGSYALKNYSEKYGRCKFNAIEVDSKKELIKENNIIGYSIILDQLERVRETINDNKPLKIFSLGGGCGIEVPIVSYLYSLYPDLTLFWFDAHGDLNTPESSPSKYFHGMPLRFLIEKIKNKISENVNIIPPGQVHLIGTRDLDEPEKIFIESENIDVIVVEEDFISKFMNLIRKNRNKKAYIHIDLDVIDPKYYKNVKCPTKNGLKISELIEAIKLAYNDMKIIGFSIVENTETDKAEIRKLGKIIRLGLNI